MTTYHKIISDCFQWDLSFNGNELVLYSPFGTKVRGCRSTIFDILKKEIKGSKI
jgi:hypothetical protein